MLNLTVPKKIKPCKVRTTFEKLDEADQKIFAEAIANRNFSARDLSAALQAQGVHVSESPIWRHRNGECSCSRS